MQGENARIEAQQFLQICFGNVLSLLSTELPADFVKGQTLWIGKENCLDLSAQGRIRSKFRHRL